MHASPMVRLAASRPLAAWAADAPTAESPVSTTANELVKPTSAVTTPARIGRESGAGGAADAADASADMDPRLSPDADTRRRQEDAVQASPRRCASTTACTR